MADLMVTLTDSPKAKCEDESKLGFGKLFTDHMFIMEYDKGQGWHDARIEPYHSFVLDPASLVFHYAQTMFEGLKAYKTESGDIHLFRPRDNFKRMNTSAERMCAPQVDPDLMVEYLKELIKVERDWIPSSPGTSLYIRPTLMATEAVLGVKASDKYLFYIILSPVGAYYAQGLKPVRIYVEDEYVRSVRGGTGFTKAGANYAISLKAGEKAYEKGFSQVLWLDGVERKNIEEVGAMNMFFIIDGVLTTPKLTGSILPGITRASILEMAKREGLEVSERVVSIDELFKAHEDGKLQEVFGTGTAAVVSPVGEMVWKDKSIKINEGKMGKYTKLFYEKLTGMQLGKIEDEYGWIVKI